MSRTGEESLRSHAEDLEHDERAFTLRGSRKPCTFCEIVAGRAEAYEVLRTERIVAFLDIRPVFPGHVLMIPTEHVQTYDKLPVDMADEWLQTSQRLQRAVESATDSPGSLLIINNVVSQSVPHLHLHLIPRKRKDGLRLWLGPRMPYSSAEDAAAMARRIRDELAGD